MPDHRPRTYCSYVVWSKPGDPVPQVTYFKTKAEADAFAKDKTYEGRTARARRTTVSRTMARRLGFVKE